MEKGVGTSDKCDVVLWQDALMQAYLVRQNREVAFH